MFERLRRDIRYSIPRLATWLPLLPANVLLMSAVGLLLVIACANVSSLLLARPTARSREFAVRLALGASRIQLLRLLLAESILLSVTGGVLGLVIAKSGVHAILAAAPQGVPAGGYIGVNASVLGFALAVSTMTGLLFGIVPELKSSKTDIQLAFKEAGRGLAGGNQPAQRMLVVAQIALAVVLLTGGGLLLRTTQKLLAVNRASMYSM